MDAEDADPGGAVHPTVFYGLWPRFTAEDEAEDGEDAGLDLARTD